MVERHFGDKIEPLEVAGFEQLFGILQCFEIISSFIQFQKSAKYHKFAQSLRLQVAQSCHQSVVQPSNSAEKMRLGL